MYWNSSKRLIIYFLYLFPISLMAQYDSLRVELNKENFSAKDTISITARFQNNGYEIGKGTLFLKILDQNGHFWNMRWPILNGVCEADLVIPDSFPGSSLTLYFGATRQFFNIYGFVKKPAKLKNLQAFLLTEGKEWLQENITLNESMEFEYKDRLFQNEATILFKLPKGNNDDLDIGIVTLLDSPLVVSAFQDMEIVVGNYKKTGSDMSRISFQAIDSFINAREKMLAPVIVTAKKLTKAQQFNEKYTSGMFKSIDERTFDLLEDKSALSNNTIMDYIKGRVAGLRVLVDPTGVGTITWRNGPVYFYLDEMRVDFQTVSMIPISEVAIIKAFPPPFYGNPFGEGGAIAIYTKRGEFYGDQNRHSFRIHGYTPQLSMLKSKSE